MGERKNSRPSSKKRKHLFSQSQSSVRPKIIMTKVDSSHLQKRNKTHSCGGGGFYKRASSPKEGRIGSELLRLRWIIFLPVHPALDVTRIQLAPPFTVFHTSFFKPLTYPPITKTDPSDSTTLE